MSAATTSSSTRASAPVGDRAVLVYGDDPGLLSQTLTALLARLASSQGGAVSVEEYGVAARGEARGDEPSPAELALAACRTPPFLSQSRVVVLRDTTGLDSAQTKAIALYLAEPVESSVLVLVHPTASAPASLAKAVRAVGSVIDAVPAAAGKARAAWYAEHLRAAPVRLAGGAASLLAEHLGEDIARLEGILATLHATYGDGASITAAELEPLLGSAGGVAPWDLTDAIDSGDAARAISALHRMTEAGERHPLQVIATLHRHVGAMLRLDGSGAADEATAASLTGMRPYPAKKALAQSRRLGHARIVRAIELLAAADLDLRGAIGWPPELVLEVLVARLARLVRERPTPTRAPDRPVAAQR